MLFRFVNIIIGTLHPRYVYSSICSSIRNHWYIITKVDFVNQKILLVFFFLLNAIFLLLLNLKIIKFFCLKYIKENIIVESIKLNKCDNDIKKMHEEPKSIIAIASFVCEYYIFLIASTFKF